MKIPQKAEDSQFEKEKRKVIGAFIKEYLDACNIHPVDISTRIDWNRDNFYSVLSGVKPLPERMLLKLRIILPGFDRHYDELDKQIFELAKKHYFPDDELLSKIQIRSRRKRPL